MPLQATSGAASYDAFGGGVPVVPTYIEDVMSVYLYTGNNGTQTIANGIDLTGKGGLVWIKDRTQTWDNLLVDSARGNGNALFSNTTSASTGGYGVDLASNGFNLTSGDNISNKVRPYVSWTFRKQPKFFDVVTYTGDGTTSNTISHNLGSTPGCIIIKPTQSASFNDWRVWHRSLTSQSYQLKLNTTDAEANVGNFIGQNSTTFTVGYTGANQSGIAYVAYLFAHDAGGFGLTGTDNVISCGTFDANLGEVINLGYEPQWLLYKDVSSTSNWRIADTMRGLTNLSGTNAYTIQQLSPNTSSAESANSGPVLTSTGFTWNQSGGGNKHIYIAIRRGPMKVPTSGTSVFSPEAFTGNATTRTIGNITTDSLLLRETGSDSWDWSSRLTGSDNYLQTNNTSAESSATAGTRPSYTKEQLGVVYNGATKNQSGAPYINYLFKRAPSVFDEVCFTTATLVNHNLGVAPELVIYKTRSVSENWYVCAATNGIGYLNLTSAWVGSGGSGLGSSYANVSATQIAGDFSGAGVSCVAYLFATCAGVSKVGSYTGNGSSQTINCGFTSGSRLVLIKRTDSTGNWTIFDSARGIVSGNDPALYLNSTSAEVTSADAVDTDSTGFVVNQEGTLNLNVSSATYIFLSVA